MKDLKFNNEYDMIIFTLFKLLDHFEKQDELFAGQFIWWLASIIQFTKMLIYYWHYKIFPSAYINGLITITLEYPLSSSNIVPDSKVPEFQLDTDVGTD